MDSIQRKDPNHASGVVYQVFVPSTPLTKKSQCYGRFKEISGITKSLREPGKHVLLFGGRGYGKTSLVNMVTQNISEKNSLVVRINCHRSLNTFTNIWREVFKKTLSSFANTPLKSRQGGNGYFKDGEKLLAQKNIGVVEVMDFFRKVNFPFYIILDEADLITHDLKQLGMLADCIKALSDQIPEIKLLIVGVANNSRELIGEHTSLERCLVEFKIDRMNARELFDILDAGLLKVGMKVEDEVKQNIILFSHGIPYFVHLLSLYAVEDALSLQYKILVEKNFHAGVIQALGNIRENFSKMHKGALGRSVEKNQSILETGMALEEKSVAEQYYLSRQNSQYQVDFDAIGFTAQMVSEQISRKKQMKISPAQVSQFLNSLLKPSKGILMLKPVPDLDGLKSEKRYCFINPLFRAFLHLRLYESAQASRSVFFIS